MIYNIDFHGTIADDLHDQWIRMQVKEGRSLSDSSSIWDDYGKLIHNTICQVSLNHNLLKVLSQLKNEENTLNLFTNANYTNARDIKSILDGYVSLFDSFTFCDGKKSRMRVEGIVVDNEKQNLNCGIHGNIFVPTFKHEGRCWL